MTLNIPCRLLTLEVHSKPFCSLSKWIHSNYKCFFLLQLRFTKCMRKLYFSLLFCFIPIGGAQDNTHPFLNAGIAMLLKDAFIFRLTYDFQHYVHQHTSVPLKLNVSEWLARRAKKITVLALWTVFRHSDGADTCSLELSGKKQK